MSLIPRDSVWDMNHFFDHFLTPDVRKDFFSPQVDIKEKNKHYEIIADLPGVDKDHLNVTLENGVLTIEASAKEEKTEEEEGKVIRRERRSGKFMRSFNLGSDIQQADIDAQFKNGFLKLKVPKATEQVIEPKRIEIR